MVGTDPVAWPVRGDRIRLRAFQAGDLPVLRRWLRPGQEWKKLDAPYYPEPSPQMTEGFLASLAEPAPAGEPPRRAAIAGLADDGLLGLVTWYWESRETNWRRLGIVLYDPATWGQGLGTEAFRLWTGHVFAATDVCRLDFSTWSGNPGMIGIGRRLGFVEEGRFRRARIVDGVHYDAVVMGILREEWERRGGAGPT